MRAGPEQLSDFDVDLGLPIWSRTGAKADHAAYVDGDIDVAEWAMPEYGSVRKTSWTAEGVVAERVNDWV